MKSKSSNILDEIKKALDLKIQIGDFFVVRV